MKRKQIIDLITAIILIVLGSIILLFPLLKIVNVKYIFMGVLSFYGIMNLLKFILYFVSLFPVSTFRSSFNGI